MINYVTYVLVDIPIFGIQKLQNLQQMNVFVILLYS